MQKKSRRAFVVDLLVKTAGLLVVSEGATGCCTAKKYGGPDMDIPPEDASIPLDIQTTKYGGPVLPPPSLEPPKYGGPPPVHPDAGSGSRDGGIKK